MEESESERDWIGMCPLGLQFLEEDSLRMGAVCDVLYCRPG
jgi:hypothetical protein